MVYIKVSDGIEIRKFQVTPGEVSFDQLRERLATLFPKAFNEGSHALSLLYRDADGDVITLSSDQEFQLALSQLKEDDIWKVSIKNTQRGGSGAQQNTRATCQQRPQGQRNACRGNSLFHHLFEPSVRRCGGLSDIWGDLELQLQLLHDLHKEIFPSDSSKAEQKSTTEGKETSEGAEATPSASTETEEDPEEAVKSKPQAAGSSSDGKEESSSSSASCCEPQWQTRRFVSWEPQLRVGPFGFFHSHLTPVVYNVSFKTSSSPSSCSPTDGECCSATSSRADETQRGDGASVGGKSEEARKESPGTDTSGEAATESAESSITSSTQ